MTTSRSRLLLLAVGLLTAGPASAATLSIYAKMSGTGTSGPGATAIGRVAPVSGTTTVNCFTNGTANCVDSAASGPIVLEATSQLNATFLGWVGCPAVAGAQCTLDLTTNKTVTANFAPAAQSLTVKTYPVKTATYTPAFGGKVTAATTPAIDCGREAAADVTACATSAATGSSVVLTAVPLSGSKVASWSGCTSSTATTCTVSMTSAKVVSVTFGSLYVPVTAQIVGAGTLTAAADGTAVMDELNCPGDCTAGVNSGSPITIIARPASGGGSKVLWSGCDTVVTYVPAKTYPVPTPEVLDSCTINSVAAAKAVYATFKPANCSGCHTMPPSSHGTTVMTGCATCHPTYTATTTDPALHMNGAADSRTCNACHHSNQHKTGGIANGAVCLECHPFDKHRNGVEGELRVALPTAAPAGFGFNLNVVAVGVPDATYPNGYVDIEATDAAAVKLDLRSLISTCATYSRSIVTSCTGANVTTTPSTSNRTPRVAIGEVLADGSFKPVLANSSGAVQTSETINISRLTETAAGSRVYRYTPQYGFLAASPYDAAKTYRAVVYGGRYFKPAGETATGYYSSDFADLAGTAATVAKETVNDAACNGCHGKLTLHGMRRGVAICLTCHNPSTPLGTGTTDAFKWDLKNLVHKVHSGLNYDGINPMTGVQGTAWGTTMDASHMAQGPSHSLYFEGAGTTTSSTADDAVHQLPTQIACGLCHQGAQASNYLAASQAGCSSCHPINWATGAGHGSTYPVALEGETLHPHTDAQCAGCHPTTGPVVMDFAAVPPVISVPVATVHSGLWEPKTGIDFSRPFNFLGIERPAVPFNDGVQRHKLVVDVTAFTMDTATNRATIDFTVTLDGAPYTTLVEARAANYTASADVYGGVFPTCAFTLAGPAASDYVLPPTGGNNLSCGAFDKTDGSAVVAVNASAGQYRVTPAAPNAAAGGAVGLYPDGTYTLSYEMMYSRQGGGDTTGAVRKPFAAAPKFYTVTKTTDTTVTPNVVTWTFGNGSPRRAVVSWAKCNSCHIQLGFHSNQGRQGPDYCAVCHNPKLDNGGRARVPAADAYTTTATGTASVYLPESVSLNVFIHRIHMGDELPSVQDAAQASPLVPAPGKIVYGATRSNFTGNSATTAPSITDLSNFAMPNPMGRCDQCHLTTGDGAAVNTWATPETARAPVERTMKVCNPVTVSWSAEQWCDATSTNSSGMPKYDADPATAGVQPLVVVTPPVKAVCTSCHDSMVTDLHADLFTNSPMSAGAVEHCAECHGAGAAFDSLNAHRDLP